MAQFSVFDGMHGQAVHNLVDDRYRPYYLRWLQRFLTGPWSTGRRAPNDALAAFAQQLEQDGRTEEWQVRQAIRSVELFQQHYLRHILETGAEVPAAVAGQADNTEAPKTFAAALGETRTLVRLRHYAYQTEQTYLEWLGRYGRFAEHRALPRAATDTARAFLADRAIQRNVAASTQNQAFNALLFLLREVLGQDVKQYLGHASVETTMIYTHVIRGLDSTAESPLDALGTIL